MRIVTEPEFSERIRAILKVSPILPVCNTRFGCVTGPGRSGAIASVYASHILRIPFIPFGQEIPEALQPVLIIDTARASGETLRKAAVKYRYADPRVVACFEEPPRVGFWYESGAQSAHHEPDPRIISRAKAKGRGLDRYFTGKVCANGHVAERYVSQCSCVECIGVKPTSIRRGGRNSKPIPPGEIVTRDEALERGFTFYNDGRPCKKGHLSNRYVRNHWCVECAHAAQREARAA